MRRSSRQAGNSLQIAFIFVCTIVLLFIAGMFLKLFLVLRASTFDGQHQYIVEITGNNDTDAFVAFNPLGKSVNMLKVSGKTDEKYSLALGVPVDASISVPIQDDISKMTEDMLFHDTTEKNMTIIDRLRLLLFVNTLNPNNFHISSLQMSADDKTKEKLLSTIFLDQALYGENESIAVVNATGESGLASRIAHMLSVIGMNVVSVTTADVNQDKSTLFATQDNTYTVERISKIFHLDIHKKTQTISDVTITLGKDSLSQLE